MYEGTSDPVNPVNRIISEIRDGQFNGLTTMYLKDKQIFNFVLELQPIELDSEDEEPFYATQAWEDSFPLDENGWEDE